MTNKSCQLYYALLPKGSATPRAEDFKSNAITGNLGYGSIQGGDGPIDGPALIGAEHRVGAGGGHVPGLGITGQNPGVSGILPSG